MNNPELGKLITSPQEKDAVHVAIFPAIAGEKLRPGNRVKLKDGAAVRAEDDALGIVDPFLRKPVKANERFWLLLYPDSITSLRHLWSHPAFEEVHHEDTKDTEKAVSKEESEKWLREFAEKYGMKYDEMIGTAESGGDYIIAHDHDLHGASELDEGEYYLFWQHMESVTGKRFDEVHRHGVEWSCSC